MQLKDENVEEERAIQMKYIQYSSLESIKRLATELSREVDLYYPVETPAQRVGHYLAKDLLSIVGVLQADVEVHKKEIRNVKDGEDSWLKYFPAGTRMSLSPFKVEELIERRESEIEKLQVELCRLKRRTDRLLETAVRE